MFDYTKPDYAESPVHPFIWERLVAYGRNQCEVGHFLTAVLRNDFKDAIARADESNLAGIHAIMLFVVNELPSACQGNSTKVNIWLNHQLHCALPMILQDNVCSCISDAKEALARADEIRRSME